jgi:5-carboxymethyl-2-hydroxymuconate isomerase
MPHLTIEYSGNLHESGRFAQLCETLGKLLQAQSIDGAPVYPPGGIRVRAYAVHIYHVADGAAGNAFVHASLKIGAGRPETVRQATGEALFEAMKAHFSREFAQRGLALSLEIAEFSEAGTWKHNNLHARLKA